MVIKILIGDGDKVALSSYVMVGRVWVGPSTDGGCVHAL